MKALQKLWSAFLIFLCTLNAFSVDEAYSISGQGHQEIGAAGTFSSILSNDAQGAFLNQRVTACHLPQNQDAQSPDRSPVQHQCHFGHCVFTVMSDFQQLTCDGPVSLLSFSSTSLFGVILAGPRRPPRA